MTGPDSNHNVVELLKQSAHAASDRTAIAGPGDQSLTYAQLWRRVTCAAAGLAREGLKPGDRAVIMVPMDPDLYAVLLGILKMGAVAVFVDPWVSMRKIARFAAYAGPRGFIGVGRSHTLRMLEGELRGLPVAVTTGPCLLGIPARASLRRLEQSAGDEHVFHAGPDDPALITFTTGSSGEPKGANRTHGLLLAQHEALSREFPSETGDVDLTMFPVFGLHTLACGNTLVIPRINFKKLEDMNAEAVADQMAHWKVTTCTASPAFVDHLASQRNSLPPVRRILAGGAHVSDEQIDTWTRAFAGAAIDIVYGSTEAEPVAHIDAAGRRACHAVAGSFRGYCAGRLASGVKAQVIAIEKCAVEKVAPLARGETGELVVRGAHVCRDYYRNPLAGRENKIREADGTVWHRMGDTGYFDADGRFWLVGRVHSAVRKNSTWWQAQIVERAAVGKETGIIRAAVVGLPGSGGEERLVVVIEATERRADLEQGVLDRLRDAGIPVDEVMVTSEPLPLDPRHRGKVEYEQLKKRLS